MRSILTADLHLTDDSRDEYRFGLFPQLIEIIEEHKVERVIFLGDITDKKDNHSAALTNRISEGFVSIARRVSELIVVPGNHDSNTPNEAFFRFLNWFPRVRWVSAPWKVGKEIFIPHTSVPELLRVALNTKGCRVAYCHQAFRGARNEVGSLMDGFPVGDIPRGLKVYAGDIHSPQTFDQVTYVGAPYHIRFGDDFAPRVLLLDDDYEESIPLPSPYKHAVTITSLRDMRAFDAEPGDMVKVTCMLRSDDVANWQTIRERIKAIGLERNLVVESVAPKVHHGTPKRVTMGTTQINDKEAILAYSRRKNLDKKTLQFGLYLWEKAR